MYCAAWHGTTGAAADAAAVATSAAAAVAAYHDQYHDHYLPLPRPLRLVLRGAAGALRCGYRAVWLEREGRSPSAEEQLALPPADEGRWTRARSLHDVLRVLLPEVESAGH
uniref:Uncharacterized protein n=1 Tax=Calcidiscus leptoporus TaxID=127549 RepID=A0A7S0J3D3_9EUKA